MIAFRLCHGMLPYNATPSPPPSYDGYDPVQHDSETTTLLAGTQKRSCSCARMKITMVLAVVAMAFGAYIFRLHVYRELILARGDLQNEKEKWTHQMARERKIILGERDGWDRELEGKKAQWDRELALARKELQSEKEDCDRELTRKRRDWKSQERDWEAKREREHRREEQWHREEEARERLGLFWDEPKPEYNCLASGTRGYWSLLRNVVPYNYNWLTPCMEIQAIIQGVSRTANRCEVKTDGSGSVYGHWIVDDAKCTPYWDGFKDKGCTAPGSRTHRYEAHLANIPDGEDWMKICSTTPYDFLGRHFDRPHSCMHRGKRVYANWEIEDWDC